jgi:hypothetical protein
MEGLLFKLMFNKVDKNKKVIYLVLAPKANIVIQHYVT